MDEKFFCDLLISLSEFDGMVLKHPTNPALIPLPIAKIGKTFHMEFGQIEFTEKTFDDFIKNFNFETKNNLREVGLNYNHPIRNKEATAEQKKSAGKINDLFKYDFNGERYLMGWSEPTEQAKTYIKNKEYNYVSPEFYPEFYNKTNGKWEKSAWLRGAALLPSDPQINLKISNFVTLNEQINLNKLNGSKEMDELKELFKKLGVVSFAECISKIDNLVNLTKMAEDKIKTLSEMVPKAGQKIVDCITFDDAINMAEMIKRERKAENEKKFETLFNSAIDKGSVKPAEKEFYQKSYFLSDDHSKVSEFAEKILTEKAGSVNMFPTPQGGNPAPDGKPVCFSDRMDFVRKRDKLSDEAKVYETARDEFPEDFDRYRSSGKETQIVMK